MLRVVGKYNPGMLRRFLIVCLFSPFAWYKRCKHPYCILQLRVGLCQKGIYGSVIQQATRHIIVTTYSDDNLV